MLETVDVTRSDSGPAGPVRHKPYGSFVLGGILVVMGSLWLLDALEVLDLRAAIVLPAVLAVVGLALVAGSFDGSHSGLIVAGIFLTVAVVAVAAAPEDAFVDGIGERTFVVEDQTDLAPRYDLAVGDLELDLSDLRITGARTVRATVGAGEMRIHLPADVEFHVDATVGAGEMDLLGETADGISVARTYTSGGFDEADVTLTLDLDVAAGEIEVTR